MNQILLVGIGGFLGAVSRYGVYCAMKTTPQPFPLATLTVNVLGCIAIGFLFEYFKEHQLLPTLALFIATGFLGAFTTFSAFSLETIQLVRHQELKMAALNVIGNLVLCFAGVLLGGWLGSLFKSPAV